MLFPNPFNPNTIIRYSLKEAGKVTIDIYSERTEDKILYSRTL